MAQIAQATKISVFYLQAIEKGEIQKLPGTVYTRSYLRQYANAIEYDENDLLESFGIDREAEKPPATVSPSGAHSGRLGRLMAQLFHVHGTRRTG